MKHTLDHDSGFRETGGESRRAGRPSLDHHGLDTGSRDVVGQIARPDSEVVTLHHRGSERIGNGSHPTPVGVTDLYHPVGGPQVVPCPERQQRLPGAARIG